MALNVGTYKKLPYDPVADFAPLTLGFYSPLYLLVNSSVPARNVEELVALAKTRRMAYASTGNGGPEETAIRSQLSAWLGQELDLPFLGARYTQLYANGNQFRNVVEDLEVPSREYADYWFGGGDEGDLYKLAFWFEFEDNNYGFGPIGATLEKFLGADNAFKLARYRWCWQQRLSPRYWLLFR